MYSADIFKTDAEISRTNGSSAGKELQVSDSVSGADKFQLVSAEAQLQTNVAAVTCVKLAQFEAVGYIGSCGSWLSWSLICVYWCLS